MDMHVQVLGRRWEGRVLIDFSSIEFSAQYGVERSGLLSFDLAQNRKLHCPVGSRSGPEAEL